MTPVTLTVLTAVLLLAREVNSQDDSDDDDGTEGEVLNSPTFPKQKIELYFFCKVSLAGSTCSWRGGRFGESVRCQPGEVAAGACGSGAQAQCGEWSKSV